MLRSPPRSALSISAINGMKINLVLRRPRANCLFVLTTTHCIDLVSNVPKAALVLSIAIMKMTLVTCHQILTVCIIEKRYVCISCSRRRRKSVPNFSFPTSFNQTTASSSNQTFLLVPDRPPPGEVVQYFEFEMIGWA